MWTPRLYRTWEITSLFWIKLSNFLLCWKSCQGKSNYLASLINLIASLLDLDKSKRDTCGLLVLSAHQIELFLGPKAFVVWQWAITVFLIPDLSLPLQVVDMLLSIHPKSSYYPFSLPPDPIFKGHPATCTYCPGICAREKIIREKIPSISVLPALRKHSSL